uniref:Uncharacterized protein n=1 Tax=viral metagenome TaxID=1070528 RepID=A0A6C0C5Q7_9ZZZZ
MTANVKTSVDVKIEYPDFIPNQRKLEVTEQQEGHLVIMTVTDGVNLAEVYLEDDFHIERKNLEVGVAIVCTLILENLSNGKSVRITKKLKMLNETTEEHHKIKIPSHGTIEEERFTKLTDNGLIKIFDDAIANGGQSTLEIVHNENHSRDIHTLTLK